MGYPRLLPILTVADLDAERAFYTALGLILEHEQDGFIAFTTQAEDGVDQGRALLFGLQAGDVEPAGGAHPLNAHLVWQIETTDVDEVMSLAAAAEIEVIQEPELQPWGEWICTLRSPNRIVVDFEGRRPAHDTEGTT